MSESPDSGRKILGGLLAMGILGGLWYFVGKGDRAFERSATALRAAKSYRVDITDADKKSGRSIWVVCPDRFRVIANSDAAGSGSTEFVVIGKESYARAGESRWIHVPMSFVSLPALNLCSGPPSAGEAKDLAGILDAFGRRGRIESTGDGELSGFKCQGWQAVPRGPTPDLSKVPHLNACIDEATNLPVQVQVQGTVWTFSAWNQPASIEAPVVEAASTAPQ